MAQSGLILARKADPNACQPATYAGLLLGLGGGFRAAAGLSEVRRWEIVGKRPVTAVFKLPNTNDDTDANTATAVRQPTAPERSKC